MNKRTKLGKKEECFWAVLFLRALLKLPLREEGDEKWLLGRVPIIVPEISTHFKIHFLFQEKLGLNVENRRKVKNGYETNIVESQHK